MLFLIKFYDAQSLAQNTQILLKLIITFIGPFLLVFWDCRKLGRFSLNFLLNDLHIVLQGRVWKGFERIGKVWGKNVNKSFWSLSRVSAGGNTTVNLHCTYLFVPFRLYISIIGQQ